MGKPSTSTPPTPPAPPSRLSDSHRGPRPSRRPRQRLTLPPNRHTLKLLRPTATTASTLQTNRTGPHGGTHHSVASETGMRHSTLSHKVLSLVSRSSRQTPTRPSKHSPMPSDNE